MRPRFAVLSATLALAATSLAFIRPAADAVKGYRAVLVEGPGLEEPVRIHDLTEATGLAFVLMRSMRDGEIEPSPEMEGRPCLRLGAFLARARANPGPPVETLTVEQADFTYWLYPALGAAPATIYGGESAFQTAFTGKWFVVSDAARTQLDKHGVPVSLEAGDETSCERPSPE